MQFGYNHSDQHFDNLLDFSSFDQTPRELNQDELSLSKDRLNLTEKEKTREESYEDIVKQINQTKLEQKELNQQLQNIKQQIYKSYLGRFREEFDELNQENCQLRIELNSCTIKKKQDKYQKRSNRSSFKIRSSVNSVFGDQNKKTHSKNNQPSPNILVKNKQIKLAESTNFLGRSQVLSPQNHHRRQSQMTQRKADLVEVNISYIDDKYSQFNIQESVSKNYLSNEHQPKNVFISILQEMLKEEVVHDHDRYGQLYLQSTRNKPAKQHQQIAYIDNLQEEIKQTNSKLQMLQMVLNRYQLDIKDMNVNLKSVQDLTQKLFSVKGKYVQMQKKCVNLHSIKQQLKQQDSKLQIKKGELNEQQQCKHISSVQTLIKIFNNNQHKSFPSNTSKLYRTYYYQIKELFKFNKEEQLKRQHKMVKVREMIDTIRLSRRKFNQLIQIYEARILKLQQKINRVRKQQSLLSSKQNKK